MSLMRNITSVEGAEHGLGVLSMRRAAERLGDNLLCSVEGDRFWLRGVL